jgi:hypothetical protein
MRPLAASALVGGALVATAACGALLTAKEVVGGTPAVQDGGAADGDAARPPLRHCVEGDASGQNGASVFGLDFTGPDTAVLDGGMIRVNDAGLVVGRGPEVSTDALRVTVLSDSGGSAFVFDPIATVAAGKGYCARLDFRAYFAGPIVSDLLGPGLSLGDGLEKNIVFKFEYQQLTGGVITRPSRIALQENGAGVNPADKDIGELRNSEWIHMAILVVAGQDKETVEVSIEYADGTTLVSAPLDLIFDMVPSTTAQRLWIGIGDGADKRTPNVFYDHLSLEFDQP